MTAFANRCGNQQVQPLKSGPARLGAMRGCRSGPLAVSGPPGSALSTCPTLTAMPQADPSLGAKPTGCSPRLATTKAARPAAGPPPRSASDWRWGTGTGRAAERPRGDGLVGRPQRPDARRSVRTTAPARAAWACGGAK